MPYARRLDLTPHQDPHPDDVQFWVGRTLTTADRRLAGTVVQVSLCNHRRLCRGVRLHVRWDDGLRTEHCSDDLAMDDEGNDLCTL